MEQQSTSTESPSKPQREHKRQAVERYKRMRRNKGSPLVVVIAIFVGMFLFSDFIPYLRGVADQWVVLMSGSISVAISFIEKLRLGLNKKIFYAIAAMCVFVAGFRAWHDEYIKTHPGVILMIDELDVGVDYTKSYPRVLMIVDVANRSQPTTLDEWQLTIKFVNGKTVTVSPDFIDSDAPIIANSDRSEYSNFKMESSDVLYNKTKPNPVPTGAKIPGFLAFSVHDGSTQQDLEQKGNTYTLTCKTIFREEVKVSQEWTGVRIEHQYYPGLKAPPK